MLESEEASKHQTSIRKKADLLDIPNHWKITQLGAINKCRPKSINPLDYPDEIFEYYSIPAFLEQSGPLPVTGRQILSNKFLISNHTVLFGKLNPRILKVWLVNSTSKNRRIASTEFIPICTDDDTEPEFIYYLCQSDFVVSEARRLVSGSTPSRQRVDPKSFSQISVPIPPRSEQQAIARLLKSVQNAKEERYREIKLERERKAVIVQHLFTYGTRDESTKQTEIGEMPESWVLSTLETITISKNGIRRGPWGGSIKKEIFVDSGYKVYEQKNVISNDFNSGDYFVDRAKFEELEAFAVRGGDVLITAAGTMGRLAIVPKNAPAGIINQALVRIRLDENAISTCFFKSIFEFYVSNGILKKYSHGATQKNLSSTAVLKRIKIALPPLQEQHHIESLISAFDEEIATLARETRLLDELFNAMLEELMTGHLSGTPLIEVGPT